MRHLTVLLVLAAISAACGHKVGDACTVSADCAPSDTSIRVCDQANSPGGYCTVVGCDYNTCPSESICARFYPGLDVDEAKPCARPIDCATDEVCTVGGRCAPRSIEIRFCMLACS